MKRTITLTAALLTVGSLAACGSSGDSAGGSTSTHTTTTATSTGSATTSASPTSSATSASRSTPTPRVTTASKAQKWAHSLCSKLDSRAVAKAVNGVASGAQTKLVTSDLGYLTMDRCQLAVVTSSDYGSAVSYALSTSTWTVAQWEELKKTSLKGDAATHLAKIGAHGALVTKNMGWVLVGDRIVNVLGLYDGTAAQVTALLKLAVPKVASVQPWPDMLGLPACGTANAEAATVLGGPATVRRDEKDEGGADRAVPYCGWATHGAAVSVSAQSGIADPIKRVHEDAARRKKGEKVKGLGAAAVYFPSSATLEIATKKNKVTVEAWGERPTKEALVALGKAVLPNY